MKDYNDFKSWDPSKGDYINEEQHTLSQAEKAKKKRKKILFSIIIIIVFAAIYMAL